jgi:glycosyltransferase involved in cell wall biosynthesis
MRGGEKCLEVFCELFPQADVYTLVHQEGSLSSQLEEMPIYTSFLQYMPRGVSRYRYYLPLFPTAAEMFDLSDYDVILSSSHCVAKGVQGGENTYHISYVHAPMRYVWDSFDVYFRRRQTSRLQRYAAELMRPYLKYWDKKSSQRVHTYLCNSRNIRTKILDYYGREAQVIYPPVDVTAFEPQGPIEKQAYYLMVGAFAPNKRADLAIEAFNRLQLPLKIVGTGQDFEYCRTIAEPNIEFLGNVASEQLPALYQQARAFLFPGVDDFGITPLEAQAAGTPVIAFAAGGALETVTDATGLFFDKPSVDDLCDAVEKMEKEWSEFDPAELRRNTRRFGRERYAKQIAHAVTFGYRQWRVDPGPNVTGSRDVQPDEEEPASAEARSSAETNAPAPASS